MWTALIYSDSDSDARLWPVPRRMFHNAVLSRVRLLRWRLYGISVTNAFLFTEHRALFFSKRLLFRQLRKLPMRARTDASALSTDRQ